MSQFDPLIISSLLFSLFFALYFYYFYQINVVMPFFVETKKFRNKKILKLNKLKSYLVLGFYYYSLDFKYLNLVSII